MRKVRTEKKAIDPERLKEAVKGCGLTLYEAGEYCGKSNRFIYNFYKRREIPVKNIDIIKQNLGLSYSDYCPLEKEETAKKAERRKALDLEQLVSMVKKNMVEIELEITPKVERVTARPYTASFSRANRPKAEESEPWILCSDRLPSDKSVVLATVERIVDNQRWTSLRFYDGKVWRFPNGDEFDGETVVAWKPIPAPYEEERK